MQNSQTMAYLTAAQQTAEDKGYTTHTTGETLYIEFIGDTPDFIEEGFEGLDFVEVERNNGTYEDHRAIFRSEGK